MCVYCQRQNRLYSQLSLNLYFLQHCLLATECVCGFECVCVCVRVCYLSPLQMLIATDEPSMS